MRATTLSFRTRRAALRRRWLVLALIGLLSSLIPVSRVGLAQDADEESPKPVLDLMAPIRNQLGASAWLAASGMDPRFLHVPAEEEARRVVDWTQFGAANGGSIGRSASGAPLVPFRSAAPSFSRNVIVTRQFGLFPLQTEPSIAVDPTDPQHLVLGTIDYNFPSMSVYVTFDGGQTWEGPKQVPYFREDFSAAGDPGIAFDRQGNVYMSSISLGDQPYRIGGLVSDAQISSMVVNVSTDGGLTWSDAVSAARSTVETTPTTDSTGRQRGDIAIEFLDKPWMTVGRSPTDPAKDVIYLTYTDFKTHYSLLYADEIPFLSSPTSEAQIMAVHSDDGGKTWSDPVPVSPVVFQTEGSSEPGGEGEGAEGAGREAADALRAGRSAFPLPGEEPSTAPTAQPAASNDQSAEDADKPVATESDADRPGAAESEGNSDAQQQTPEADEGNPEAQEGNPETQQVQAQESESEQTVQGSQPKVLSDGTLVVTYLDTTADGIQKGLAQAMVAFSHDGGATFSEPVQAGAFQEIHFTPRNSNFRWWGGAFPQLAVGPKDEIYVAVIAAPPDKPTDDGDVYLFRSLDKGQTWLDPVRINQDDTTRIQFFPSIAVSPDGVLHAMWGDMRDDPSQVRYNIYYSQSTDQGATWGFVDKQNNITTPDTRVTDFASNALKGFPGGEFLGDYFSIAATDDDVFLVWADTRLGEFNGPMQQIAFARRTAITPPSLFLNPPSGDAGRDVTIQGFGFQPVSNIAIDVGGITITNLRSDDKGQFTTDVYMPVTGEGPRDVSAFDDTGNVATASFYTTVGFDTIANQLQQVQSALGVATPQALPSGTPALAATPVSAVPTVPSGSLFPEPTVSP
jgi:hypothetical protein